MLFKKQVLMVGLLFLFLGILNESRCDSNWPPEGNGKRYEVTRDTSISSVGREKNGNQWANHLFNRTEKK